MTSALLRVSGDEHARPIRADAEASDNAVMARRSYGTGSLIVRTDAAGRESWHAKIRVETRQVWRRLGERRAPGSRQGLTRTQAEGRLRKLIEELERAPSVSERLTIEDVGRRYLRHLTAVGRRRSTLTEYESYLRVHLAPFFGDLPLQRIGRSDGGGVHGREAR